MSVVLAIMNTVWMQKIVCWLHYFLIP